MNSYLKICLAGFVCLSFLFASAHASEWIAVKDKYFPKNENVIFFDHTHQEMWIGSPEAYIWYMLEFNDAFVDITHWMPLPAFPKDAIEKDSETQV